MGKIESFFESLASNDVDIIIKGNGSAIKINGDGIGGLISPKSLQKGYDSIKTMAAQRGIEITDKNIKSIETKIENGEKIEDIKI